MKIARFNNDGLISFGIIDDDELVVLKGDPMFAGYDPTGQRVPVRDVKLLAPVIPRSKIVGMAWSYFADEDEQSVAMDSEPRFFLKPNTAVVGPGDPIVLPAASRDVRVEGELAIVIGKITKNVSVLDAEDSIFGYTIANDVTAVDLRERDGHLTRAKSFDSFCPLGPVIDTEFDWTGLSIESRINGETFQEGTAALLKHTVAEMISFVSGVFTLLPGDVILTGAPGRARAVADGDTVQVEIAGIGVLSNPVRRA
ncbi:FAA hydrolase family protein [Cryobacterium sp. TMT1-21]|uniref:FAA hydrolase family protein n=1 Tax=Cryobacterium shii TaxID=1259235 RepID=A0AAQ2C3W4_9MICO|nr:MULTISPECIES: fumarylacetoacetate hydrolase family protein [Cryobacterium]TFC41762.1 FAA hydrolase family protein [Cryobacterium shii]TFC88723.1 FAA hydrolase family protein [Cryobacterium sp. TmT2-59]TFD12302.1 FAA hydrolase family protein [Cryobacterium sp. TMT1-21]TFD16779.1 FAA hydrolase family protein [Cryobacterium sp. TMT4-10]TFD21032.1 FAA hydrolase family protein [Cryobacterium sp. TMT2-23]